MPLENATNIPGLVVTNPASGDGAGSTDNQIRMFKGAVKGSFPGFTGAENVTLSEAEINALPQDIADAQQAAIDDVTPDLVPLGAIVMWAGSLAAIPSGWALCDGNNGTPNLQDRFIVGAGSAYAVGASGGADTKTTSSNGAHNHGGSTDATALTEDQLPQQTMNFKLNKSVTADDATGGTGRQILTANRNITTGTVTPDATVTSNGGGQTHAHGIPSDGAHAHTVSTIQPSIALSWIIKTSEPTTGGIEAAVLAAMTAAGLA